MGSQGGHSDWQLSWAPWERREVKFEHILFFGLQAAEAERPKSSSPMVLCARAPPRRKNLPFAMRRAKPVRGMDGIIHPTQVSLERRLHEKKDA